MQNTYCKTADLGGEKHVGPARLWSNRTEEDLVRLQ